MVVYDDVAVGVDDGGDVHLLLRLHAVGSPEAELFDANEAAVDLELQGCHVNCFIASTIIDFNVQLLSSLIALVCVRYCGLVQFLVLCDRARIYQVEPLLFVEVELVDAHVELGQGDPSGLNEASGA